MAKKRYWYFFTHYTCSECGTKTVKKERMYTKKPKDSTDRWTAQYRYCSYDCELR